MSTHNMFLWAEAILMSTHNMFLLRSLENDPLIITGNPPYLSPVKQICVFEHSVMTNFNFTCPAIQRDQGSGFLSEGSS